MKLTVVVLIGPPMSGKDTYIKTQPYNDYTIISRDDILMELHPSYDYGEAFKSVNQKLVDKLLNEKIQDCIDKRKNVVINMTNLTKKSRNRHLSKFPNSLYDKVAIVFPKLGMDEYVKRNIKRTLEENKSIPLNVLEDMLNNWEEVSSDEGFNKIIKL